MGTVVRLLAEQEHSAALAQRGSRVFAIMKFGAGADNDPFVKVSSEVNQKSYCDEEMSQATEKEDLEADVAKHSSKLETTVARSIVLNGEISALQPQLQCIGNVADDLVVQVVQIPQVHVVEKTTEIPVVKQRQNHMVQTV